MVFELYVSNFYSVYPPVIARYAVRNIIGCATKCATTLDCAQFNYGLRNDATAGDVNIYYCDVSGKGTSANFYLTVVNSWDLYTLD